MEPRGGAGRFSVMTAPPTRLLRRIAAAPLHVLRASTHLPLPREQVFAFFADAANLGRITPAELGFVIRTPRPIDMHEGTLIDYVISLHGIPMSWRTRITSWMPPFHFADEQLSGPYALWVHEHRFADAPGGGTLMHDEVRYRLPFGRMGELAHPLVRRQLLRIFEHRRHMVAELLGVSSTKGDVRID